jgi:hypothetical protein
VLEFFDMPYVCNPNCEHIQRLKTMLKRLHTCTCICHV